MLNWMSQNLHSKNQKIDIFKSDKYKSKSPL